MTQTKELLSNSSSVSLMRWTLLQVIRMSYVLILGLIGFMLYSVYKEMALDWSGMAVYLAGVSTFLGVAITGKWLQKKEEIKDV